MLYVSPLKALAVDVERNLRAPLAGVANLAREAGVGVTVPEIAIRTGDTPALERARFGREQGIGRGQIGGAGRGYDLSGCPLSAPGTG